MVICFILSYRVRVCKAGHSGMVICTRKVVKMNQNSWFPTQHPAYILYIYGNVSNINIIHFPYQSWSVIVSDWLWTYPTKSKICSKCSETQHLLTILLNSQYRSEVHGIHTCVCVCVCVCVACTCASVCVHATGEVVYMCTFA